MLWHVRQWIRLTTAMLQLCNAMLNMVLRCSKGYVGHDAPEILEIDRMIPAYSLFPGSFDTPPFSRKFVPASSGVLKMQIGRFHEQFLPFTSANRS